MRNHPNMSYCMLHNTNLAMDQITSALVDEDKSFYENLSADEQRAFRNLIDHCKLFLEFVEQEGLE